MAKYNTFVVCDCALRRILLVTSSARKSGAMLHKGRRIEVWNENERTETIYATRPERMDKYHAAEREHHAQKQLIAEARNIKRGIMRL